jgi:signal transduction histidine kinase
MREPSQMSRARAPRPGDRKPSRAPERELLGPRGTCWPPAASRATLIVACAGVSSPDDAPVTTHHPNTSTVRASAGETLLRRLLDASTQPLLGVGDRGVILAANAAAGAFVARDRGELLGTPLTALVPAPARHELARTLDELADGGHAEVSLAFTASEAAGGYRRVYLHRLPGEPPLVSVRIGLGAKAMEESFVVNAAHQLRAPLAGIANAIEVLQAGAKERPEDRDVFLRHIETAVLRLSQVARAMLVLARANWNEQPPRVEPVLLTDALQAARRATHARAPLISVVCEPSIAALGEWDLIAETLAALVENAIEHAPDTKIVLRGRTRDERTVEVVVEDEGAGMTSTEQAGAFDAFSSGRDVTSGFGLGLAIARQAAEAMGGTLTVEADRGTRFSLGLPSASSWP